ncbi:hypothetical protein Emag_003958 [Eimeria magna]
MGGPPVTSLGAYSFAADFVEFERRKKEELEKASTKWKRVGEEETTKVRQNRVGGPLLMF